MRTSAALGVGEICRGRPPSPRFEVVHAPGFEDAWVVGQFEIRGMVVSRMNSFFVSLSLVSGAILTALLSVATVWLLCRVLPAALRWLWVVVVPLVFAYPFTGYRFGSELTDLNTVLGRSWASGHGF
jgi:hypothetical protein